MKASRCLPALLALALAQSAQAGCQDAPGPRVNWTGCTRNLLMLGGDDLTEGVFSRANLASTDFRRAKNAVLNRSSGLALICHENSSEWWVLAMRQTELLIEG